VSSQVSQYPVLLLLAHGSWSHTHVQAHLGSIQRGLQAAGALEEADAAEAHWVRQQQQQAAGPGSGTRRPATQLRPTTTSSAASALGGRGAHTSRPTAQHSGSSQGQGQGQGTGPRPSEATTSLAALNRKLREISAQAADLGHRIDSHTAAIDQALPPRAQLGSSRQASTSQDRSRAAEGGDHGDAAHNTPSQWRQPVPEQHSGIHSSAASPGSPSHSHRSPSYPASEASSVSLAGTLSPSGILSPSRGVHRPPSIHAGKLISMPTASSRVEHGSLLPGT
jgi:hypothetical protein